MKRGTAAGLLFKEIVFSATELAGIYWNGDIMPDSGQKETTFHL